MDRICALIAAAGQGKRMESDRNKQFLLINGLPVIVHTLLVFQKAAIIDDIVIICAAGEEDYYLKDIIPKYGITKCCSVTTGGAQRQDSVLRGLQALGPDTGYVMIHDGARPFVTEELIIASAEQVVDYKAVIPGVPVKDTIKRTDSRGIITETPVRDGLWQIQTPQAFEINLIKRAYLEAMNDGFYGTDDASLVERQGFPVKVIPGSYENIKITTPEDIIIAEAILRRRSKP